MARFLFILYFPGHNTSLWLKLWRVYYGNMTLTLTNSCKERAKTQSCSTVWLFDLVNFLIVLSLSQKFGNYICFELSAVKNVECELKIQTTHFNTVSYSARNVRCRTFMFACWHLPNPPNTGQTWKLCRNSSKKELKVFTWHWKLPDSVTWGSNVVLLARVGSLFLKLCLMDGMCQRKSTWIPDIQGFTLEFTFNVVHLQKSTYSV